MDNKPTIALVSDYNFLSLSVLEFLLSKPCVVFILTDDIKLWQKWTAHLKSNNFFFRPLNKYSGENFSYSIFINGYSGKSKFFDQ